MDYSLEALRAKSSASRVHIPDGYRNIHFVLADGLKLPFADEAFDVVIGHVSMPYMNTRKALREIYRVLAPGGSIFLTFHSFYCLGQRFLGSLQRGNWKDLLFGVYLAVNGLLNHFSLPQSQVWWKPSMFETVNTRRGVSRAAQQAGFILISTEHSVRRVFFAVTARKPNLQTGAVLPAPAWAIYRDLSCGL